MSDPRIPDGMPVRHPGEPALVGKHVVLHDDGTVQMVMGGPGATRWRRLLVLTLGGCLTIISVFTALAGIAVSGILALEYNTLTATSRLACAALIAAAAGWHILIWRARRWARG
jgi:hypothetical protein